MEGVLGSVGTYLPIALLFMRKTPNDLPDSFNRQRKNG